METDPSALQSLMEPVREVSTTVWIAVGLLVAALVWLVKWAVTVLFVQGKGVSLITIPFSRVAGRILEDRFVQKLADTKTLPRLHVPASWEEFNRFNGYVAHRMQTYRELVNLVQTQFNGPSAVCLRVAVRYFEPDFVDTFRTAERGFRELDRIDDGVRHVHKAIHDALKERTDPLERERIRVEKDHEITRIKRKHAIAARPMALWLRRRLGQAVGSLAASLLNALWSNPQARALRAEKRRLRTRLIELRLEIAEQARLIFAEHEAEVAGRCLELIEHDRMFLSHLYHRFGLEVESLKFTVASGRVLELIAADTERGARARRDLAMEDLVCAGGDFCTADTLRERVRTAPVLGEYVGIGPEAVLEGTLEAYLRLRLLLGEIRLEGYSVHWVAHLPPPGEFGRAQAQYGHFAHQLAWLKRPLPGMRVLPSGLVELQDAPGEDGEGAGGRPDGSAGDHGGGVSDDDAPALARAGE